MDPKDKKMEKVEPIANDGLDLGDAPKGLFPDLEEQVKEPIIEPVEPEEKKKPGRPPKKKEEPKEIVEIPEEEIEQAITSEAKKTPKEEIEIPEDKELISPIVDMIAEKWGWEFGDEEKKPENVEEFIEMIEKTIEANSQPDYADEIVEKFDKYVRSGGDPRKFMQVNFEVPDYSKFDIKNVSHQKRMLTDLYRLKGLSDAKIEKIISKFEIDNELETEAVDAQKELDELTTKEKELIFKRQEEENKAREEKQKKDIGNVIGHIKKTNDIYGITLSAKDKEELVPYLFKRDRDGLTQQQKEFNEDPIGYLVTTAYLYKNKEKLKQLINNQAKSSAAEQYKEKVKELKAKQRKQSDQGQIDDDEDNYSWLGSITKKINKPT